MKTVIVEGWRFLAHSYAVVNQFQLLEMLRRPDLKVYHRDVPYYQERWLPTRGILPAAYERMLTALEPPPTGLKADAMLRIGFPHHFELSPEAERMFVWVTSEFLKISDRAIASGKKPWQELPNIKSTVIACSHWAGKGFLNAGLPKSRLHIIPCGVDQELFRPPTPEERTEIRRQLGFEGKFIALNISSLTYNKGFDIMLRAVLRLLGDHPSIALSLKGSDDLYQSTKYAEVQLNDLNPADREKLAGRVIYQGVTLSAMDMVKLYQAADIYLTPYRAEGFNLPVLEAAACGLPVICTRGGSTDDFVDDSWALRVDGVQKPIKDGTVIEPNLDQFTAHLDRAIRDEAWRAEAGRAARQWVCDRFTWKHSVDKLLKVMLPG
jgi:glycosyltransferase involved in cell wall biosynthesis